MITFILVLVNVLFSIGILGTFISNRGLDQPTKKARWKKFWVYYLIVHVTFACAWAGLSAFMVLMGVIVLKGGSEIISVRAKGNQENKETAVLVCTFLVYIILAAGLIAFSIKSSAKEKVFVFMIICMFDGFSQIAGQIAGKHHFLPNISPGKTLEGAIGGILSAAAMAIVLGRYFDFTLTHSISAGLVLAFSGLAGDITASYYKRLNGVKDFGKILPGHGGVLDRFDSFISGACAYFIFYLQ